MNQEHMVKGGFRLDSSYEKKSRARLYSRLALAAFFLIVLGLTVSFVLRVTLPTKTGWELLPLNGDNIFAQNIVIWLAGRCYVRRPLVKALEEAGEILNRWIPGAKIGYLDASGRKGGDLLGHLSHKHGRDVDICFFGRKEDARLFPEGPQIFTVGYILNYDKDGRSGSLTFDRGANLFMIVALLEQKSASVEKIFVEPYMKKWLLVEAKNIRLPDRTISKLSQILRYAGKQAAKHDDHLHVRFALPEE
jgi:penicillin-insensitive murein endopeptidase